MTFTSLDLLRANSFERLHLKRNPFGEVTREERAELAYVDTLGPATFLKGAQRGAQRGEQRGKQQRGERRALQLLADHGRGKSTLLLAIHAREFPSAPYTQLHAGSPVPVSDAPLQFVDSIENLSWIGRRKLYAGCQVLAFTTHRDLSGELRRAGFGVISLVVGIRSVDELSQVVDARIAAALLPASKGKSRRPGGPPRPSRRRLEDLFRDHRDDVRSIEQALYADYERARTDVKNEALLTPTNHA